MIESLTTSESEISSGDVLVVTMGLLVAFLVLLVMVELQSIRDEIQQSAIIKWPSFNLREPSPEVGHPGKT